MYIEDEEIKQIEEDNNDSQQGSAPFFEQEEAAETVESDSYGNPEETEVNTFPGQAVSRSSGLNLSPNGQKAMLLLLAIAAIAAAAFFFMPKQDNTVNDLIVNEPSQNIKAETNEQDVDTKASATEDVAIIEEDDIIGDDVRMVSLSFDNVGRANPFMPGADAVPDVRRYGFDLIAPPESITSGSPASRVMTTKISGIMYDKYNPSAILNIEGEDYFVRSGDNINGYKILAIAKDMVTVQLGSNVYKTRVGEAITEGEVNYNNVYDLKNKFGGARK